jgi:ABC-2 type transport system permease protein
MGPFFIFVYFLILETSKPHYDILVVNNDKGYVVNGIVENAGTDLTMFFRKALKDSLNFPLSVEEETDKQRAVEKLVNQKADALIIIPYEFSEKLHNYNKTDTIYNTKIEFIGDLTNLNYLISSLWANGIIEEYSNVASGNNKPFIISETALGKSGSISDFDLVVPGILIISLIMLMFTATIAFISEVENRTIIRLKMSKIRPFEFISGISLVQLIVGIVSILLTLCTATLLGFKFNGSIVAFLLITILTSLSIIAFSLIIASVTKTINEVLIVGNFPLFLFMFFTGAAFPLKSEGLFKILGYPISIQGLMSATHSISALNKILIMNMKIEDILPEIISIIILTVLYFAIGLLLYNRRHMQLEK